MTTSKYLFTDIEIDYISHFNMSIPLTDSTRKLCFDVVATDDMELELSEFASFFLLIEYGINITVERSMTTITILDNDSMYIYVHVLHYIELYLLYKMCTAAGNFTSFIKIA